jgi:hypothetical protein
VTDVEATATAMVANAQVTATTMVMNANVGATATAMVAGARATVTASRRGTQGTTQDTRRTQPAATTAATTMPTTTAIQGTSISPYIFGTNLGLFDSHDQVLSSATTQSLLQSLHVQMIRIPVRSNLPNSLLIQAAQVVQCIGATPLIILRGSRDPNALSDDLNVVQEMNQIFGQQLVYYEFGNEDDLGGVNVTTYTNAWNQVIPQMQKVATNAAFVGPVNFQYNHNYLQSFLLNAHPLPYAVSWHEYTCSYKWAADLCLSHIAHWSTHISDARALMQSTIGNTLPIMITEWNYAPDQTIQSNGLANNDGKYDNASFMTTWTTQALQTLIANHVFASMQYSATNTALPIVSSSDTITPQGGAFQSLYTAYQGQLAT